MFDERRIKEIMKEEERWEKTTVAEWLCRMPERQEAFTTPSGIPIKRLYTPKDIKDIDYLRDLGFPGEYPFTRGIHATMYRGRLWTMRQFSGYGTPEDTNKRWKYLVAHGETGLSTAFDYPTIMGLDPDHPMARGEVGVCGVSVPTLRDMEILFDGIPMDQVTTSMTINHPTTVLLAFYIATAENQGVPQEKLGGTVQNDNLKEFHAQKLCVFPPEAALKLSVDVIEYCAKYMPKWNPISISGYHIREAGATAVQELAFTIYDGIVYVEETLKRGLKVDDFAPRLSFFFALHNNFFEEIAKLRAARRLWAKIMKERFHAKNPRSMWCRFHVQTSGCTLTAQQPLNNIVRVAIQALAAVLGGCQSLHTNSYDEALCLPSWEAVTIALRTQQIIAYETGVTDTIDPLGGSYYVEWLTKEMEERAMEYIQKIDDMGGIIPAIEKGFIVREISDAAYRYQREIEEKKRIIVGVNEFVMEEEPVKVNLFRVDPEVEEGQIKRVNEIRRTRNNKKVKELLEELRRAAEKNENVMPYVLKAVKAYATLGEIIGTLKEVYGEYKPETII